MDESPYGGSGAVAQAAPAPKPQPTAPRLSAPAHGFGSDIAWETLEGGLARAQAEGRPLMMVVHADWCGRCKELRPVFFDEKIATLSKDFVMVNVDQDAEPKSLQFTPDGKYVPRVMFIDPSTMQVDQELLNERRSRTRYFYTPADDIAGVMKKALSKYERT